MSLDEAMHIITETHTRDDRQAGFVVEVGASYHSPTCRWSPDEYMEAWRTMRRHLHLRTEPREK